MSNPAITPELKITNFKASLDFYTKLAGFKVLYDRPEDDFAMLSINGAKFMIEGISGSRLWEVGKMEKPFGRGINFQIQVKDVNSLYQNIKKAGHPIYMEMEEKWYRVEDKEVGNKQFLVQDPDGYLLRFYESLGKRNRLQNEKKQYKDTR